LQVDNTSDYPNGYVINPAVNTLVVIGPNDASCGSATTGRTILLSQGAPQSGASTFVHSVDPNNPNRFTFKFNWDTTPFCAGRYFFELDLLKDGGQPNGQSETTASPLQLLIYVAGPQITNASLPDGVVGSAYPSTLLYERGGIPGIPPAPTFTWTVVNGKLPTGISFDANNPGTLSGTPAAAGIYPFTARVEDSKTNYGTRDFTLRVIARLVAQVNQPLVPESSVPGASGFTLTVNGTGFVPGSAVLWNGSPRITTFNSARQLTAAIPASDVATLGTASISVANTGSPSSNVDFFQITNPTTAVSLSRADFATGLSPHALISADFDADGRLDLAIANTGDNTVSILLGNGDGTFTAKPTLATGSGPYSLIAGDFNNDGKLDLAVTNFANGAPSTVSIFIGNGDGTFAAGVTYAVGSGPISVVTGDFNGDGKLDLAVANQNDHSISILIGNGDGTFQSQMVSLTGGSDVAAVATGDFDGDGKLDLAVTNPSANTVSVLLGNGNGTFQPPAPALYVTGDHPIAVSTADLNGDGILDLAVTNLSANTVSILLGNGDGTFQSKVDYTTTSGFDFGPSAMTTGDFNGDGKVDLAITNQHNNSVSILLGNGDGTFQSPLEFTTGTFASGVAAGDFNGDGRLDVVVANIDSDNVSVMLQSRALFFDGTFNDSNWQVTTFTNSNPAGTTSGSQVLTGGNPGAYRQTTNNVGPAPSANCVGNVVGFHANTSAVYTPTQQGAITSIDYTEDAILISGSGDGQGAGPALIQDGQVYLGPGHVTPSFSWTHFTNPGLLAGDFSAVDPTAFCTSFVNSSKHPDFSASGSPIQFGFFRSNSTGLGGAGYTIVGGIDNWTVTVH